MLESGQVLAHCRLTNKLGQGRMGVVWKAVDTKLDREVAIKFLPEQFASDPERLGRFEREAKLLAALNHRNIASIYGLDESNGSRFLVMELVEGEDLAERLARGPLPVDEALDICHQLARALESAHEKGVLHRDLKPGNVRLSHEGRVKVLDFGLAKAFDTEPLAESNPTMSPTLTSVETRAGIILGTAAYMSPEQARGKPLDKRTDIWAFGCLLYECLTGKTAFRGETVTDTLASIVKSPADWSQLPEDTPPRVRELLERCLEKDVRNRLRDIGEARIELRRSTGATDSMSDSNLNIELPAPDLPRKRTSPLWLAAAALIGAVAGIGLWAALTGGPASTSASMEPAVRFAVVFPSDLDVYGWDLSPDGRTIAYVGRPKSGTAGEEDRVTRVYLRPLNSLEARPVEGSEGVAGLAFSPDGRWLAVRAPVAPRSTKFRLLKVPVAGDAPPLALLDWRDDWDDQMLWLPDGDILVQTAGGKAVVRAPSAGGEAGAPVEIRSVDYEGGFRLSTNVGAVLPDGSTMVMTRFIDGKGSLVKISLDGGAAEPEHWLEDAVFGRVSPDGRWLGYASDVSGRQETYLRPLRADGTLGREIPVSTNGGGSPYWDDVASPMRLLYHSRDDFYAVDIGPGTKISSPKLIGNTGEIGQKTRMHTHLHDGRWMAALIGEGEELPDRVNVVLHWTTELQERMSAQ